MTKVALGWGVYSLGDICGGDLITEDSQSGEGLLLALVLGDVDERRGRCTFGLGRAEHLLVGLELEFEGAVAVCEKLVLGLSSAQLLLCCLVLLLKVGDQLLQLHATDLGLQLLRKLGGDLLLADEVHDDGQHEINQVDSTLYNVFLGLG